MNDIDVTLAPPSAPDEEATTPQSSNASDVTLARLDALPPAALLDVTLAPAAEREEDVYFASSTTIADGHTAPVSPSALAAAGSIASDQTLAPPSRGVDIASDQTLAPPSRGVDIASDQTLAPPSQGASIASDQTLAPPQHTADATWAPGSSGDTSGPRSLGASISATTGPKNAGDTTGPRSINQTTGPHSVGATTGPHSVGATTGPHSVGATTGPHSVGATTGPTGRQETTAPQSIRSTQAPIGQAAKGKSPLPTEVAGHTILKELGRGGMGVVYKARQPGLNRLVALKMILGRAKGSKREREMFRAEAEVIAKLQHPNIVQIYEIGEHNNAPYFSLEYVEGGCLADRITKEGLAPTLAARIVKALAEGMDMAHSQGILHRDLKPANILLGGKSDAPLEQLIPKITDFGLAKQIEDSNGKPQQADSVVGTPSYMPPEQAEGRNWQLGPPADIYSLGAVLYDLLTGTPPFRGANVGETLRMVTDVPPTPPRAKNLNVARDLEIICLKCLEKDPAQRYRSARELADDLDAFLTGAPIKARSYTRWERTRMWVRRRPLAAALLAVSIAAVAALGIGGVMIAAQQSQIAQQNRQLADDAEVRRTLAEQREQEAEQAARTEAALRHIADNERQRAEQNLDEAKVAVRTLTDLGHQRLSKVPNMEPVRRELLAKALAFHRRFLEINGDRPDQQLEIGRSHVRVGEIEENLGHHEAAESAYRNALTLFTRLLQETPQDRTIRRELATTWNDLAIVQQERNVPGEAKQSFTESLRIKADLVTEDETNVDLRREFANGLNNRGNLYGALLRQPKEAEADYRTALAQLAKVPQEQCLENLGETWNNLAAVLIATDSAEAARAYDEAIRCWKKLEESTPDDPTFQHSHAAAVLNRAIVAHVQGKADLAEQGYKEALQELVKLTTDFRGTIAYRETYAEGLYHYAKLLRSLKRFPDAEKQYRLALPVYRRLTEELPNNLAHRQKLANSLNELGVSLASQNRLNEIEPFWNEAIRVQEALIADAPTVAAYWQDLVNSRVNLTSLLGVIRRDAAVESATKLVALQQQRVKAFPQTPALHSDLATAHFQLAGINREQNKPEAARAALTDAVRELHVAIAAAPNQTVPEQKLRTWSLELIDLQLQAGQHAEARQVLGDLLRVAPADRRKPTRLPPEQAAVVLASCITAAQEDKKIAATDRDAIVKGYGDEAMKWLDVAVKQGFKDAHVLGEQEALKPLRDREDFRNLVKKLQPETSTRNESP